MMDSGVGIKAGDWAVFRAPGPGWTEIYDVGVVERVTAKTVYARACYKQQHALDQAIKMPDEESARLLVARINSAFAEAEQRVRKARGAANEKVTSLLAAANPIEAGTGQTAGLKP